MKYCILALLMLFSPGSTGNAQEIAFRFKPSPIDNPIRGLAPYASMMPWLDPESSDDAKQAYLQSYRKNVFPHSMEFHYFSMRELMPAKGKVDFSPIEKWLYQTSSRGCQLTFRVFLEYPGRGISVPQFLVDGGLKIDSWKNSEGQIIHAPNYEDENLRQAIDFLVAALGEKYDGDPRVACLTMGILGHWGEWHSYPRGDLFPGKDYQQHLMQQFAKAFAETPVLMRYPAGPEDGSYAANNMSVFGFHDDSFAWATRITGKEDDNWFFLSKMRSAGALDAWKTRMIGGEIRPEVWGCVFDKESCAPKGQGFKECVADSHVTWLMDSGMFDSDNPPPGARVIRAAQSIGAMGYEFYVPECSIASTENDTTVEIAIENRGVAPFYFDWPVEIAILDKEGEIVESKNEDWNIPSIMPGAEAIQKSATFSSTLKTGHRVGLRILNPMPGGMPIRFANENQKKEGAWLILK